MKNEEKTEKKQTREITIRHLKEPENFSMGQIMHFGFELSRNADGSINRDTVKQDCDIVFEILTELKKKIENANLSTE